MLRIIRNGLATGMVLQLAVGPVFLFTAAVTLEHSFAAGLAAAAAATLADLIFIVLAMLGIGRFIDNPRFKKTAGAAGSLVLCGFGAWILAGGLSALFHPAPVPVHSTYPGDVFIKALALTLTSPLTILFWGGIFTRKAAELNISVGALAVFGVSAGLTTFLFLGLSAFILSRVNTVVPPLVMSVLPAAAGALILAYGMIGLVKVFRKGPTSGSPET